MFEHSLDNSATVRMGGQLLDLSMERLEYEPDVHSWDSLDGLLYDMIAILVFDAFEHISFELLNDGGLLFD